MSPARPSDERSLDDTTFLVVPTTSESPIELLIVEDDPVVMEFLRLHAETAGYAVATAETAEAALDMLARHFRPVVIVDRNLPGISGVGFCRELRSRSWPGYVYTILLTGQDSEADVLEGLEAGADDYVSKKASIPQLLARVRTAQRIVSLEHTLRTMAEERRRVAMTDELTGVANRRYLMRHLGRELTRAVRQHEELAVLAVDIDHFKKINDAHGHAVGDAVLVQVVQRMRAALPRESDWCARTGGEEFVVVLPCTDLAGAVVVARRILESVSADPIRVKSAELPVTVSIGVATLAALAQVRPPNVDGLLKLADDCLYESKHGGRNRMTLPRITPMPRTSAAKIPR